MSDDPNDTALKGGAGAARTSGHAKRDFPVVKISLLARAIRELERAGYV